MTRLTVLIHAIALLLLQGRVTGYYDRMNRRAPSFSRRRGGYYSGSSKSNSNNFISLGKLSLGSDGPYDDDIMSTRNVNTVQISSSTSDADTSSEVFVPVEVEHANETHQEQATTAPVKLSETPMPDPVPEEPVPEEVVERVSPITNNRKRKISVWVSVRRPSKSLSSASSSARNKVKKEMPANVAMLDKKTLFVGASQPLIPEDCWNQMTGEEYNVPGEGVVQALATSGQEMATNHENNEWVDWKDPLPANIDDEDDIFVTTGTSKKSGFASDIPWIKSVSILPMSPEEGANLIIDSSRVKMYNKLSVGREDVKIILPKTADNMEQQSKIVRNIVQLPVANKQVESVAMLHAQRLPNGAHLIVSRALAGTKYASLPEKKIGKSYILLGVNLFEPIKGSPDQCKMTAVTHAFSPGVPLVLAKKLGVKSAKDFIKDLQAAVRPVSR